MCAAARALAILALLVTLPGTASAQLVPDPPTDIPTSAGGSTEIPVGMPGGTEVLDAEAAASTSRAAPIALEEPIDPKLYICGPGDVFELNFWGRQNFRLRVSADLEGRTFISKIGFVEVAGKTLAEVRKLITQKVKRSYPGLRFDLTLTQPRSFKLHVAGYVKSPGAYTAHPLERVSSVLDKAGGITGSRRRIQITRADKSTATADLVLYEHTGKTEHNPRVLDGDLIMVPVAETVVSIAGPVHRPGTYELTKSKDLAELLDLAGGFTSSVAKDLPIRVVRKNKDQRAQAYHLPFKGGAAPNRKLRDQDAVLIRSTDELQRSVMLIGAVTGADPLDQATTAKRLPFIEGDTVRTLVERAGGIRTPGDLENAYISRPKQGDRPELIPVDLEALLVRRDFSADKPIHMGDTLVVPRMRRGILVEGAVTRAGTYDYNPRFRIGQYVATAGGRTRTAQDMDDIRIIDPQGRTRPYRPDLFPRPGDTILVPERNFTRAEIVQIGISIAGLVLSGTALYLSATR